MAEIIEPDTSAFSRLLDALNPRDAQAVDWIEDELHPRRTGFVRPSGWIEQEPAIPALPGDVVLLREYVIVRAIDGARLLVEQIRGDEFLDDPDYVVVANRQRESGPGAPQTG